MLTEYFILFFVYIENILFYYFCASTEKTSENSPTGKSSYRLSDMAPTSTKHGKPQATGSGKARDGREGG